MATDGSGTGELVLEICNLDLLYLFMNMIAWATEGSRLDRCFVIVNPAALNTLSDGTEVAGIVRNISQCQDA